MTKKEKFILNVLREGTIRSEARNLCYRNNGRQIPEGHYENGKIKLKWYWTCQKCQMESRDKSLFEVDHIKEIGTFTGDWNITIERMYCEAEDLQLLCIDCHKKKTLGFNATLRYERKKKPEPDTSW